MHLEGNGFATDKEPATAYQKTLPILGEGKVLATEGLRRGEHEAIFELIAMLRGLALEQTVFRANHTSNPVPLEGRLPRDRDLLIAGLESILPRLDRKGPGRLPFAL